ncbi:cobaltochelatase subunit CobN, partial [Acinetobacter baumannii]
LLQAGHTPERAGREAAWRVFGDAPGAYGAGVNRMAERSGSWTAREQLGRVYLRRMGHAYGMDAGGEPAHAARHPLQSAVEILAPVAGDQQDAA